MNGTAQRPAAPDLFAFSLLFFFAAAVFLAYYDFLYVPLWTIGDWLVNYSAGFVRRGLPGEVFLLSARVLHVPVRWIALVVPAVLYSGFLLEVYRLANPLRRSFLWFAMLFSPATIPFIVLNAMDIGFRKETLLLASLALFIYLLQREARDVTLGCTLALLFATLTLSHEGTLICFPYFLAATALVKGIKRAIRIGIVPLLVACVLFVVVSRYPGEPAQARVICQSIGAQWTDMPAGATYPGLNGETGLCAGSIAWIGKPVSLYRQQRAAAHPRPVFQWRILGAFLPFCLAALAMYRKDRLRQEVLLVAGTAFLCFLGSISIFFVALDWGRWIYMQTACLLLITLFAAQRAPSFHPALPGHPATRKLTLVSVALGVATLLYCVTWTVPTNPLLPLRDGYWDAAQRIDTYVLYSPMMNGLSGAGHFFKGK